MSVSRPRILPMGDRALLIEVGSLAEVLALHARLQASAPDGVRALVPAARTVLVEVDPRALPLHSAKAWIDGVAEGEKADAAALPASTVELDIVYDGPDLADTAAMLGMTMSELAARHAAAEWTVAFTGFAPGFGYLVSPGWRYDLPRLDVPRTRVPVGAVGVAGEFTGAYPRDTPGGWRLLGRTSATLFDATAEVPALLAPGAAVRFRPVAASAVGSAPAAPPHPAALGDARQHSSAGAALRVVEPGLLATVQDLGRPGQAALGIARSGALDRGALRTANRLVGNPEGAAGIEVTMGGFRAVAERDLWIAVTGAFAELTLGGHAIDPYRAQVWPAGVELGIGWAEHGVRTYLAVRGGIAARAAAGSRSTDLLAGLGPPALRAGDEVAVGTRTAGSVPSLDVAPWGPPSDDVELELAPGPRTDWFAGSALSTLFEQNWTVSSRSDRIGVRLEGSPLRRTREGELPSEGMVPGAIQVPPSGLPTVLLADGPVTGGYPVIAVVSDASLDAVAQVRPGARIRFRHARQV